MSHIVLVRHGQANSGARDEQSYDRLSALGHEQAHWLGAHFEGSRERFARVYCGTLRRHRETAEGIGAEAHAEVVEDARLNELHYFDMARLFEEQHGEAVPEGREAFAAHMPRMFAAWRDGRLEGVPERFEVFDTRVRDVLREIAEGEGRALVVTSGGLIGTVMGQAMGLSLDAVCRVCLAIMNTSLHRYQLLGGEMLRTQFNAVPHLEHPERQFAQTHI